MSPRRCLSLVLSLTLLSGSPTSASPPLDPHGDPLPPGAVARLGTLRFRIAYGSPAFISPDGKRLFVEQASRIQVWDAGTGAVLCELRPDDEGFFTSLVLVALGAGPDVRGPALSPDGNTVAAQVGDDVCVWDAGSGRQRQRLPNPGLDKHRLSFCAGGKVLAVTGSSGDRVRWWDLATGKRLREWDLNGGKQPDLPGQAWAVPSPDGRTLLVVRHSGPEEKPAGAFGTVWDTGRHKAQWRFEVFQPCVTLGGFSPGGRFLLADHGENTLALRESATGKVHIVLRNQKRTVIAVAYSGDGKLLALGYHDLSVCLWDTTTGKLRRRLEAANRREQGDSVFLSLHLSADGAKLAVAVNDSLRLWDTTTGQQTPRFAGHRTAVEQLGFSPDGRSLLSCSTEISCRWDTVSWKERERGLTWRMRPRTEEEVRLAVTLNANRSIERGKDGRLRLCELISGRPLHRLLARDDRADYVFADNGKVILMPQQGPRGRDLVFLDTDSGKEVRRVRGAGSVELLTSPDGRMAAWMGPSDSEPWPHFLDARGKVHHLGKELAKEKDWLGKGGKDTLGEGLAVSADGRYLTLARGLYLSGFTQFSPDEEIYLWETASGKLLHVLASVQGVAANMAFSPNGRTLAVTYAPHGGRFGSSVVVDEWLNKTVYLWETLTGRVRGRLEGHQAYVCCLAWSPDGHFLASGSADTTALVWDMSDPLKSRKAGGAALTVRELADLWADLGSLDGEKAYRAIGRLAGSPRQTVAFLRERLRPVAPPDPVRLRKLAADLDSRRFAVRNRAAKELETMQEAVAPVLRGLLGEKLSLEYRRRIERLLEQVEASVPPPERLRTLRAVEVLEGIGSAEARQVLQALARGTPEVRLTREARAAVKRLASRGVRP